MLLQLLTPVGAQLRREQVVLAPDHVQHRGAQRLEQVGSARGSDDRRDVAEQVRERRAGVRDHRRGLSRAEVREGRDDRVGNVVETVDAGIEATGRRAASRELLVERARSAGAIRPRLLERAAAGQDVGDANLVVIEVAAAGLGHVGDVDERGRVRQALDREEAIPVGIERLQGRAEIGGLQVKQRSLGELVGRAAGDGHVPDVRDVAVRLDVEDDSRGEGRAAGVRDRTAVKEAREAAEPERLQELTASDSHVSPPRRGASGTWRTWRRRSAGLARLHRRP